MTDKDAGTELGGKTSDRIRSGEIPEDALSSKRLPVDNSPKPESVRRGKGHGLGKGATRKRSGEGAETHED